MTRWRLFAGSTCAIYHGVRAIRLACYIVQASLSIAAAILLEAALSFLGVGVKPPTPTWGGMLRHAFETVSQAPWLTVSPEVVIFLVVLACNFFGDALRDVLDPKLRGTR